MPEQRLPQQFRDLEQWLDWSLPTEKARSDRRQASDMQDLRAFYDSMLARMDEILPYLERFPMDQLPDDAGQLLNLTLSLAEVAPAIEQFGQPSVIDGYDVKRFTTSDA